MSQKPKRPQRINQELILNATTLTRASSEGNDLYLKRVTHLHLQNKRIASIDGLELCENLKVLYLYDNLIEKIENLDFAVNLQYLQLQNNQIKEIPDLSLQYLSKLMLDYNQISFVSGLEACVRLEELHISYQRLPDFTQLTFDFKSLEAISRTLQTLEISGNNISSLSSFRRLLNLRKLSCANNAISDLAEIESIIGLYYLAEADFQGNPCCKTRKYRDYAISASSDALRMLDEVPVFRHQQVAIRGLMAHRVKIGTAFPTTTFAEMQGHGFDPNESSSNTDSVST
jgi:protein phosphatase 1 regulatory subunit 42